MSIVNQLVVEMLCELELKISELSSLNLLVAMGKCLVVSFVKSYTCSNESEENLYS